MKKDLLRVALAGLVGIALASCSMFNEASFDEGNLYGYWQENGTEAYVRFKKDVCSDDTDYKYGYEWDEGDGVYEDDLENYGGGWFKWKLVKSDLTEIHFMTNGGAEIPKVYTVTKLTETDLQYKDDFGKTHSFQKIVK